MPWTRAMHRDTLPGIEKLPAIPSNVSLLSAASGGNAADIHGLTVWLQAQQLINFDHRGVATTHIGQPESPLLVVCQMSSQPLKPAEVPLGPEESRLFDLMIRAIELNRSHLCLCAVGEATGEAAQSPTQQHVSDLCTRQTRGLIFLSQQVDDASSSAPAEGLFGSPPLPIWRMPHPSQLIINPQRKRDAWECLKAIRHLLSNQ